MLYALNKNKSENGAVMVIVRKSGFRKQKYFEKYFLTSKVVTKSHKSYKIYIFYKVLTKKIAYVFDNIKQNVYGNF